jgi:hypothetical protein
MMESPETQVDSKLKRHAKTKLKKEAGLFNCQTTGVRFKTSVNGVRGEVYLDLSPYFIDGTNLLQIISFLSYLPSFLNYSLCSLCSLW